MTDNNKNATDPTEECGDTAVVRPRRRRWPLLAGVLLGVPALVIAMMFLVYLSSASAQTNIQNRTEEVVQPVKIGALAPYKYNPFDFTHEPAETNSNRNPSDNLLAEPIPSVRYPASFEKSYREETYRIAIPNPDKNGPRVVYETRTRRIPVTTRTLGRATQRTQTAHQPQVIELANDIRLKSSDPDDDERKMQIMELRKLLDSEFALMHERQAKEIESTTKRLESLRELHDERGKNSASIVQRRIDQLIGASNALDWNPGVPSLSGAENPVERRQVGPLQSHQRAPSKNVFTPTLRQQYANNPEFKSSSSGYPRSQRAASVNPAFPDDDAFTKDREHFNTGKKESGNRLFGQGQLPGVNQNNRRPSKASAFNAAPQNPLNEIFDLVGKASHAAAAVDETKRALEQNKELHKKGAIPILEMQKSQFAYDAALRDVRLYSMQVGAMRSSLKEILAFQKSELQSNMGRQRSFEQTAENRAEYEIILNEKRNCEYEIRQAQHAVEQFEKAVKLIPAGASITYVPKRKASADKPPEEAELPEGFADSTLKNDDGDNAKETPPEVPGSATRP